MKCSICKQGETHRGITTVTLQQQERVIIFKKIPAHICENCGEYYLSARMTEQLLTKAQNAIDDGAEVEILHLPAKNKSLRPSKNQINF